MRRTYNHAKTLLCILIIGSIFTGLHFPSSVSAEQTQTTFNSEAAIDGYIAKWGRPYPPQQHTDVSTGYESIFLGQWRERDTTQPGYIYCIERGYVSFSTALPGGAIILSAKLKLKTRSDFSLRDFTMEVRGGPQPVYGSSLEAADWGCGTTTVSTWNTASYPGNGIYIELSIPVAQVNVAGRTQFELKSNREGTSPTGDEYVNFYSGDSVGNEPKLEVTYRLRGWTFMIYLDADNNLEAAGIGDFLEMAVVGSINDVAIVVQMDRAVGYDVSNGNWVDCRRFYITQGLTPAANPIQNLGEANMGDPNTLINFVQWAVGQYPSNNYVLVLWDHGGGAVGGGVCYDDASNSDYITMAELRQATTSIRGFLGKNINILGFDACLMQMTEVAYQIRDTTDIVVGSEEVIPGDGWPYDDILADITANPSVTPATLAQNIVTRYVNSYQGGSQGTINYVTLAAFYESNIVANLVPTVSNFADRLSENLGSYGTQILDAMSNTEHYSVADYGDLYDFAYEISQRVPVSNVQTAAQNVMDALVAARIAEGHGPSHPQSHGLSIYLTDNPDSSYGNLDFSSATHWDEFLQNLHARVPGVRFSLREHGVYRPTYSPDIRFLKPSSSVLRIDSHQAGAAGSLGLGWAFVVVPRDWLNGKYIRFSWSGYYSWYGAVTAGAYIYDGEYDRANDADFPEGAGIPTKGAGLLQTLALKNAGGNWGPETRDVQANVAAGTQSKCTIFFYMGDAWIQQTVYLDIDWFQINQSSGGVGTLAIENFDADVTMERTGTYKDYGYISNGVINP